MGGWRAAGERPSEYVWKVDHKGILTQRSFRPVTGILESQDFHLLTVVCPCRERLRVDCDAQAGVHGCGWPCVWRLGLDLREVPSCCRAQPSGRVLCLWLKPPWDQTRPGAHAEGN